MRSLQGEGRLGAAGVAAGAEWLQKTAVSLECRLQPGSRPAFVCVPIVAPPRQPAVRVLRNRPARSTNRMLCAAPLLQCHRPLAPTYGKLEIRTPCLPAFPRCSCAHRPPCRQSRPSPQALAPTYEKLAKRFAKIDSVVIAKMDGTENEHPEVEAQVRSRWRVG